MISILKRDILLSVRSGTGFSLSLSFFLLMIIFAPLAIGPDDLLLKKIAPGIIWLSALLSCLLSIDHIFQNDFEDGSLEALMIAPIPLEATILIKTLAHWVTSGLLIALIAPLIGFLYNFDFNSLLWIFLSLLVGTPSLSMIGVFGASLTIGLKKGGLLLPVLIMPFYIPTLIFGSQTIMRAADGLEVTSEFLLMAGITALVIALMPFAATKAVKASLK